MNAIEKVFKEGRYELSSPIKIGDDEITELALPFSEVRGRDLVAAQSEYETITGTIVQTNVTDKGFHAYLVSRIAKIPYDTMLDDVGIPDFNILTGVAQYFLLRGA